MPDIYKPVPTLTWKDWVIIGYAAVALAAYLVWDLISRPEPND